MSSMIERNKKTLDTSYGISAIKLAESGRTETVLELQETVNEALHTVNGPVLYDCEVGISDAAHDEFTVSIYLHSFDGENEDYDGTKARMVEKFLSMTTDAVNKMEKENVGNSEINKTEYIAGITKYFVDEVPKLGANMTIMCCDYYIGERLTAALSNASFDANESINYFDRFLAVTESLNTKYWNDMSASVLDSSLYGADDALRKFAATFGLYEVEMDSVGRTLQLLDA